MFDDVPISTPCCPSAGPGLTGSADGLQKGPWLARWDEGVEAPMLKHMLPIQIIFHIPAWDMFPITVSYGRRAPYEYIHVWFTMARYHYHYL